MTMPRRDRRSGVRFIEDNRDRSLTFFKRRSGLFKLASDLSTLTGARVALVLESEHGKFSSFGTPEASPILDAFLLGSAPTDLDTSEADKASITNLQNEVFQLEKDKTMEDRRRKEGMARANDKIQEASTNSKLAKYAYGNIEDLDAPELFDMCRELSRVQQEVGDRLATLLHEERVEADARLRDPSLLQPSWWRSTGGTLPPPPKFPPQVAVPPPPKFPPWAAPFQACFQQHPWPSSSTSASAVLARSGSSLLPNYHYPLAPHTRSTFSGVQFQAPKTTPPAAMEAHHSPYSSYPIRGIDIHGKKSSHRRPFSLSPILSSSSTPQPPSSLQTTTPPSDDSSPLSLSPPHAQISSPLHLGSSSQQHLPFSVQNYSTVVQPPPHQHYANVGSAWIHHSHQLFYSNLSSPELNVELGNTDKMSGGTQVGGGYNERSGWSSPQQSDGGFDGGVMLKSFYAGESSSGGGGGGGDAGGNLGGGGLNFPGY